LPREPHVAATRLMDKRSQYLHTVCVEDHRTVCRSGSHVVCLGGLHQCAILKMRWSTFGSWPFAVELRHNSALSDALRKSSASWRKSSQPRLMSLLARITTQRLARS